MRRVRKEKRQSGDSDSEHRRLEGQQFKKRRSSGRPSGDLTVVSNPHSTPQFNTQRGYHAPSLTTEKVLVELFDRGPHKMLEHDALSRLHTVRRAAI